MRRAFTMVLLLGALGGCVTEADLRREREWREKQKADVAQAMSRWDGITEGQLVDGRGPPSSVYVVGRTRYLSYSRSRIRSLGENVYRSYCDITFRIEDNVVNDWQARGDCY